MNFVLHFDDLLFVERLKLIVYMLSCPVMMLHVHSADTKNGSIVANMPQMKLYQCFKYVHIAIIVSVFIRKQ